MKSPDAEGVLIDFVRESAPPFRVVALKMNLRQHQYQVFSNQELARSFDEHISVRKINLLLNLI